MLQLKPDMVRILDLDGSVTEKQPALAARIGPARTQVLSARELGTRVRYMAHRGDMKALERLLLPERRNFLTFLGSGDFHHVTAALLRKFPESEPLSLVVFDRHPDWDRRSLWHCCGSWVGEALKLPHLQKIVFIGLGREDIQGWRVNVGPVRELRDGGRVAFYPFDSPASRTVGKAGITPILWPNIAPLFPPGISEAAAETAWEGRIREIVDALPTRRVYISIDKDCLTPGEAITNWEPGHLPLRRVLAALRLLSAERDVVGLDITGEYSPPKIASPWFRYLAESDRPSSAPGHRASLVPEPDAAALKRNEAANLALLAALGF